MFLYFLVLHLFFIRNHTYLRELANEHKSAMVFQPAVFAEHMSKMSVYCVNPYVNGQSLNWSSL